MFEKSRVSYITIHQISLVPKNFCIMQYLTEDMNMDNEVADAIVDGTQNFELVG